MNIAAATYTEYGVIGALVLVVLAVIAERIQRDKLDRQERTDVRTWLSNHMASLAASVERSVRASLRATAISERQMDVMRALCNVIEKCPGGTKTLADGIGRQMESDPPNGEA
jgi:hypothetical protein